MSDNRKKRKSPMSSKTKTSITLAVFSLAILVVILCIMSGSLHFQKNSTSTEPTPTPLVTAPPSTPRPTETPTPTETPADTPEPTETYTVTVFAGHGGSADPSGTTTVQSGDRITVVFTPDAGYHVDSLTVNGEIMDPADSYTIDDVSGNVSIDVTFDTDSGQPSTQLPG